MEIDNAFLTKYFTDMYVNPLYNLKDMQTWGAVRDQKGICVSLYNHLRIHFNGEFPRKLVEQRRPNEALSSYEYRRANYKPKTKIICNRVLTSLSKIRRSPDWSVKFELDTKKIPEKETPEQYFNYNYPYFNSITNWAFAILLKNYLIDSNAICIVGPLVDYKPSDGYMKPFPIIYNSDQVIDYKEGELCVVRSHEKCSYNTGEGKQMHDGMVYIVVTDTQYIRYEQVNADGKVDSAYYYDHNFGEIPAFKLRGQFSEHREKQTVWESRISPMLPELDEYVGLNEDLSAQIVQHVHSEKWVYEQNNVCESCNGTGYERQNTMLPCFTCQGSKTKKISPFDIVNVKAANTNLGQVSAPIPPAGYIGKEWVADMARLLNEMLEACGFKSLSAINMEFLSKIPASQSGIAKEYDHDESNNTVHAICEDIVWILDKVCYYSIEYRYATVVPNKEERLLLMPKIAVPEKYDLLNTDYLLAEKKAALDAKMNPMFMNKMEVEIAAKKYPNDPEFIDEMELIFELDPFNSFSRDEVLTMQQNGYITKLDAVISCNIQQFVCRALDEKEGFTELEDSEQKKIIEGYANEIIKANDVSKLVMPVA